MNVFEEFRVTFNRQLDELEQQVTAHYQDSTSHLNAADASVLPAATKDAGGPTTPDSPFSGLKAQDRSIVREKAPPAFLSHLLNKRDKDRRLSPKSCPEPIQMLNRDPRLHEDDEGNIAQERVSGSSSVEDNPRPVLKKGVSSLSLASKGSNGSRMIIKQRRMTQESNSSSVRGGSSAGSKEIRAWRRDRKNSDGSLTIPDLAELRKMPEKGLEVEKKGSTDKRGRSNSTEGQDSPKAGLTFSGSLPQNGEGEKEREEDQREASQGQTKETTSNMRTVSMRSNMKYAERESKMIKDRNGLCSQISRKIYNVLDVPDSSCAARWYGYVDQALIMFSIFVPLMQSFDPPWLYGQEGAYVETTVECIFLTELVLRFLVYPSKKLFLTDMHTFMDLLAAFPLFVRWYIGGTIDPGDPDILVSFLVGVVPQLRMCKLLRRFDKIFLLKNAFMDSAEALPVLMYVFLSICMFFSCIIYLVEPRENIASLPEAMWLTIVTMTTVGYGDVVPKSAGGSVAVAILIVCSALYMAIPLGIIGSAFNHVWSQRDCILLVKRARFQLDTKGYTAVDIPCLFKLFDSDNDGELSRIDFIKMIEGMNISLPVERVVELFDTFDSDGGGTIDAMEFIRQVFPKEYGDMYDEGGGLLSGGDDEEGSEGSGSITSNCFGDGDRQTPTSDDGGDVQGSVKSSRVSSCASVGSNRSLPSEA